MTDLHLRIDCMVVELADRSRASEIEPALRAAMQRLAHKLSNAGLVPGPVDLGSLFTELGSNVVTAEVLLSPDGPERLAIALLETVKKRVRLRKRVEGASV